MVMNTSVALVITDNPSFEIFPTPGSSFTVLRTRARGRMRLMGPPGRDAGVSLKYAGSAYMHV